MGFLIHRVCVSSVFVFRNYQSRQRRQKPDKKQTKFRQKQTFRVDTKGNSTLVMYWIRMNSSKQMEVRLNSKLLSRNNPFSLIPVKQYNNNKKKHHMLCDNILEIYNNN